MMSRESSRGNTIAPGRRASDFASPVKCHPTEFSRSCMKDINFTVRYSKHILTDY